MENSNSRIVNRDSVSRMIDESRVASRKLLLRENGQILLSVLTISLMVLLLSVGVIAFAGASYRFVKQAQIASQTMGIAEAGIDYAIRQLNINSSYAGESNTAFGDGTFTVTVSGGGSSRTIESTACIPDCTNPRSQKTIRVQATLGSETVQFFYGVQVDSGGLVMGNNSRVNGNVFSNGNIVGSNGAMVTGDAIVAGGLDDDPAVQWTTENTNQFFATSSANRDIAQSFIANETGSLGKVSVFLAKVGNPTSNITLRIHADNAGNPATGSLASGTITHSSVGTSPSWIDVTFASPPSLINGTKYWIVLDYGSNSSVNYWNWRKDATDAYPNNTGKYTANCCSGNPTWTNVGGDLAFRVWIGNTTTRIEGMVIGGPTSGTAWANLFVNTTVRGSPCPNPYCIVANQPRQNLPISDGVIQDWKNDAAAGGTHTGNYTLTNNATGSLGPRRVTGNMLIDNGATLTITGTIWVEGNVTLSNLCNIRLDPGYGTNSGLIVTDGVVQVSNNCNFQGSGQTGSYVMLLSHRNDPNGNVMTIGNNAVGVIYYASRGRIHFSNNATAREATGYGITLSNNATITYESGLQNATFTSGPGAGWSVVTGSWQEIK